MTDPCELWIKIFVVAFCCITVGTLVFLIFSFAISYFTKGGNFWHHHQQRTIEILEEKIKRYETDSDN
jgi:hypothetical protein